MTVDLATFEPALKSWMAGALGTTPDGTAIPLVREEETDKHAPRGVIARMNVQPLRDVGWDRVSYEQDTSLAAGSDYVPHVRGTREMTVTLSVESEDARAGKQAAQYLERVRAKLRMPSAVSAFESAGVSLSRAENPQEGTFTQDGRRVTKAMLDVHFYVPAHFFDDAEGTSRIDKVEVTDNELQTADGSRVPGPLQFNDEQLG